MKMLLLRSVEFVDGSVSSRHSRNQPCDTFSAVQNRALYGEIFRFSNNNLLSLQTANPVTLSECLIHSTLFDQIPKLNPTVVGDWIAGLTQSLPTDPPVHGEVSPCLFRLLEQVPIEDNEAIRMIR